MQPAFEEKRKQNILYATSDNKQNILQKSIVLEYYLKGKKTYQEIMENK